MVADCDDDDDDDDGCWIVVLVSSKDTLLLSTATIFDLIKRIKKKIKIGCHGFYKAASCSFPSHIGLPSSQ